MLELEKFDLTPKISKNNRLNMLPANPETLQAGNDKVVGLGRFPSWLHRSLPKGHQLHQTSKALKEQRLHTVCEEARCPNIMECWSKKTATFLAFGHECTRACSFCDIDFSKKPAPLDPEEPQRIADSVKTLGLKHVVITMVARDDLEDGGAAQLAAIVNAVREKNSDVTIELLTSDLMGEKRNLDIVLESSPEIFNHNIETVRRLTPKVRHKATYEKTLDVLRYVRQAGPKSIMVKSGIMVGLGEEPHEVFETIDDLKKAGCDIITIGQYLQASRYKHKVKEFVTPDQFKIYEEYGYKIGLPYMYCGPFIRSSYNANLVIEQAGERLRTINSE